MLRNAVQPAVLSFLQSFIALLPRAAPAVASLAVTSGKRQKNSKLPLYLQVCKSPIAQIVSRSEPTNRPSLCPLPCAVQHADKHILSSSIYCTHTDSPDRRIPFPVKVMDGILHQLFASPVLFSSFIPSRQPVLLFLSFFFCFMRST